METLVDDCQDWLECCLSNDQKCDVTEEHSDVRDEQTDVVSIRLNDSTLEERKGTYTKLRSASKPHSTPQTLKWLEDNYEIAEGVCIPRSTLYVHYLDYCEKHDTQPVNAASFGKIIRQQFPQLTTRRLGTRGQSKYHYYGIGVRESSKYYELAYSSKGIQSSADGKKDNAKQIIAYSPRSKLGTLLPEFPDIKQIKLPPNIAEEKVFTFLMMYRTHCQRILDTVIRANFDEVQNFLLHFWQGMPTHIKSILECKTLVTLVGVCDSILYKAIASVLMPTVLQPLPESLTQVIRHFSIQLDEWLRQALDSLPECLQRVKFDLARRFSQVLKRQTSLNHLCQAARTVINSAEMTSQMLDDWFSVDLNSIIKQTLYTMESNSDAENMVIVKLARDFEILLEDQAPLESYIEWLDHMVEQCVTKKCHQQPNGTPKIARQFLLMWSCVGTRVIRDMTLHSAPSFGSFHLLHLMFDEYVLYTVENLHNQDKANDLLKAVKGEISLDILDDILLSPPISNKPNMPGCAGADTIDLHRSSVIRPIDSPFSDTMDSMYYQQDTMRFQQPAMCSEQRGAISSHGQVSNTTTPGNSLYLNQNNCRQKPRDSPPLYSMYQQPEVASHQNNGVTTYDNFDWSRAGHGTTSISGITNEGLQKHFHQPVSVKTSGVMQLQSDIKQNSNNLNPYFPSYTNEQLNFKRQGEECSLFHKKVPNELPDIIPRQNMPDTYYHHVSNMI